MKVHPNDLCPCKSGKKYKECCMKKTPTQISTFGYLPVVEYYKNLGKVIEIDSSKDINEVIKDLEKSLGV